MCLKKEGGGEPFAGGVELRFPKVELHLVLNDSGRLKLSAGEGFRLSQKPRTGGGVSRLHRPASGNLTHDKLGIPRKNDYKEEKASGRASERRRSWNNP